MAGFRARFGRGFDAGRELASSTEVAESTEASSVTAIDSQKVVDAGLEDNGFADEEEDANLLDLISSFGQESSARSQRNGGKKGK